MDQSHNRRSEELTVFAPYLAIVAILSAFAAVLYRALQRFDMDSDMLSLSELKTWFKQEKAKLKESQVDAFFLIEEDKNISKQVFSAVQRFYRRGTTEIVVARKLRFKSMDSELAGVVGDSDLIIFQ